MKRDWKKEKRRRSLSCKTQGEFQVAENTESETSLANSWIRNLNDRNGKLFRAYPDVISAKQTVPLKKTAFRRKPGIQGSR